MYRLIIKPAAKEDAMEAARWYNRKQKGLGDEFLQALDAKMEAIQRNPSQFQSVYKGIKRAFTDRFPYGLFYVVEGDTIYVLAILHTSRSQKSWKKRK